MAYVYRHIRLDKNEPFYIGIGKDDNGEFKRAYSTKNRNQYWSNIYGKSKIEVEILMNNLSWQEAMDKEIEFIQLYGRKDLGTGFLVNMAKGGEGVSEWSQVSKNLYSSKRKGVKFTESHKQKLKAARRNQVFSEATRQKMRENSLKKGISKETREKMAAKLRGRPLPQWQREILSKAAMGKRVEWNFVPIYQVDKSGNVIKEFESISLAAKTLNVCNGNISKVLNGKRNHTGGFNFKYK